MTRTLSTSAKQPAEPVGLTVIAPCFNEQSNVDPLVDRMLPVFDALDTTAELILVDDGSTDATWERISRRAEQDVRIRGVQHPVNRGMEAGWRSGLEHAAGELVCLIDADLQNQPEDIRCLYEAYRSQQCDVIQGVRRAKDPPMSRYVMSRGLNLLLNVAFGMKSRDNKSGFILCKREVLAQMLQHRFHYRFFQSVLGAAAKVRGFTIGEVDTAFEPRCGGQSFLQGFPLRAILWTCWEIVKFRVETLTEGPRKGLSPRDGAVRSSLPNSVLPGGPHADAAH